MHAPGRPPRAAAAESGHAPPQHCTAAGPRPYVPQMWPFKFKAVYTVSLHGEQLQTQLRVINTDDKPFDFTAALHTYIEVRSCTAALAPVRCRPSGSSWPLSLVHMHGHLSARARARKAPRSKPCHAVDGAQGQPHIAAALAPGHWRLGPGHARLVYMNQCWPCGRPAGGRAGCQRRNALMMMTMTLAEARRGALPAHLPQPFPPLLPPPPAYPPTHPTHTLRCCPLTRPRSQASRVGGLGCVCWGAGGGGEEMAARQNFAGFANMHDHAIMETPNHQTPRS